LHAHRELVAATRRIGVFLGTHPHDGGAHQHAINIVEALGQFPRDRFEIVAAYRGAHWASILTALLVLGLPLPIAAGTDFLVKCVRFGIGPLAWWRTLFRACSPAVKTMQRAGCDLWLYPAQDDWTYLGPGPAIGTIHDLMHRYEPSFPEVSAGAKFQRRERHYKRMCSAAQAILVDSQTGKRHVVESYDVPAARVEPLPFVAPRYVLEGADDDGALSLPAKYLFYPAQFWMHKNHERLLRSLADAKRQAPDIALVLAGSKKNNYARVQALIAELQLQDNVVILGYVENARMGSLYRKARALVMPTFFGPTNIPPLEAFACGCPLAVSNIYGMREQVGDAGLFFDPKSVPEITSAILRLWNDDALCDELSRRSALAAARWGMREFSTRLLEIVDGLLARPQSSR
jgi:glycosyltransferase involved in cell wall biosynthesis